MKRMLVLAVALACCSAFAQQYPSKPIRLIVPFPSGGAAELGARIFAQPLSQALGQPVVIEPKAGADGIIASEFVKQTAPDGYTLYYATNTGFCWVPATKKNPPYDPIVDFTPISMVGTFGFFLFSHPSVPAKSLAELIAYVKANPGKLNYGTGNSTSMLSTAQLALLEKLDIVHIPYKGDGPLSTDLLGGRVQFAIATPGIAAPQVREGKLRALATLLPSRSPLLPDAPTMAEAGVQGLSIVPWGGLFGPAKMPREVVDRLSREMVVVLAKPEVKEAFGRLAFEPYGSSPEALAAHLKAQVAVWKKTVQQVGIKPE